MATSFPGSLDSFVNPVGSDNLSSGPSGGVSHASMHANIHDTLSALEAKVGVNSSAVTSSLDYRMAQAEKNAPVGTISMYAGSAAPAGWLLCQGQSVSFASYPELAAVFGVTGGTWNLPDLRQRVPLGSGTGYTLRTSGGATTDSITLATTNLPSHHHSITHSHSISDHAHTVPDHGHSMPDHDHSIPEHGHGNTFALTNGNHNHGDNTNDVVNRQSTYISYSGNGQSYRIPDMNQNFMTYGMQVQTAYKHSHADVNVTLGGAVSNKPAFTSGSKTGYSTSNKTGLSTNNKTGLGTSGQTGGDSGDTGSGTAFDVDIVQPYFVVNFIIRVDD